MLIFLFFSTNSETILFSERLQRFNRHLMETVLAVRILLSPQATSRPGLQRRSQPVWQSWMRSQAPATAQGLAVTVGLSPESV